MRTLYVHVQHTCIYKLFIFLPNKALEQFGGDEAAETAKFVSMFDKMFDCLNVQTFSAGKLSRNCFKAPYQSSKDFHLKVNYVCVYMYIQYMYADCT